MKKILAFLGFTTALAVLFVGFTYHVFPVASLDAAIGLERRLSGLTTHSVTLDGFSTAYLERHGPGPDVLLLHGFAGDKDNWTRFARTIDSNYRVLIPDLPPFGEGTLIEKGDFRVATQVPRVLEFADHMDSKKFHLVGNSMGGHIAALLTLAAPERVLSLTLIDSAGVEPTITTDFVVQAKTGRSLLLLDQPEQFKDLLALTFTKPPYMPQRFQQIFGERLVARRSLYQTVFDDLVVGYQPLETHLANIGTPTLIMWGDDDQVFHPSAAEIFHQGIAGSQIAILEAGHVPMIELPDQSADMVMAFIGGVESKLKQ